MKRSDLDNTAMSPDARMIVEGERGGGESALNENYMISRGLE